MKNCENFQEMMSLHLDAELDKQETEKLLKHFEECEQCKEEYLMLKSVKESLNETEFLPLPDGYHEELMEKINAEKVKHVDFKKVNRWKKYSAVAAALLVVVAVGALGGQVANQNNNTDNSEYQKMSTSDMAMLAGETADYAVPDVAIEESFAMGGEVSANMVAMEELEMDNNEISTDDSSKQGYETQRKKIRTASLSVEVENYDEFINLIETYVSNSDGYIEDSNSYIYYEDQSNKLSLKAGYLRARVDEGVYETFLDYVKTLGKVESENQYVMDVTSGYVDVEARLEVKKAEEARLLELLNKAETIEDIINIEARLSEVRGSIEGHEAQLKSWDKEVDFSTIEINVREKQPASVSSIDSSFGEKIKESFIKSVNLVIDGAQAMVTVLIVISIPAIILALVIGLAWMIIKSILKKHNK